MNRLWNELPLVLKTTIILAPFWIYLYAFSIIWNGYMLVIAWAALQCLIFISIVRFFAGPHKKGYDLLDILLIIFMTIFFVIISASLFLDLIAENASSKAFTVNDVLSTHECNQVISLAEAHAAKNVDNSYHTMDFGTWLNHTIVEDKVFPLLAKQFNLPSTRLLSMQDLFVVKYDADTPDAQRHLQTHIDSSLLSFNIALSSYEPEGDAVTAPHSIDKRQDHSETKRINLNPSTGSGSTDASELTTTYSGGGTRFVLSNELVRIRRGALLTHPSRVYHSGEPVTEGKRYILVGFVAVKQYWEPSTIWRRFGGFTKCISVVSAGREGEPDVELPQVCAPFLWVYHYDVYTVFTNILLQPVKSLNDIILKVIIVVVCVASLVVVLSLLCLCKISLEEQQVRRKMVGGGSLRFNYNKGSSNGSGSGSGNNSSYSSTNRRASSDSGGGDAVGGISNGASSNSSANTLADDSCVELVRSVASAGQYFAGDREEEAGGGMFAHTKTT